MRASRPRSAPRGNEGGRAAFLAAALDATLTARLADGHPCAFQYLSGASVRPATGCGQPPSESFAP